MRCHFTEGSVNEIENLCEDANNEVYVDLNNFY